MNAEFPVPRITESFVDSVMHQIGAVRYDAVHEVNENELNADYIAPSGIIELKIIEEEGLHKKQRQDAIAKLFRSVNLNREEVDIDLVAVPDLIRNKLELLVSRPIENIIRKASKQIERTIIRLGHKGPGVLIVVNNGYSYLDVESFEKIMLKRCQESTRRIDHVVCISVKYYQDFGALMICKVNPIVVSAGNQWSKGISFVKAFQSLFGKLQSEMMRGIPGDNVYGDVLQPVSEILFERDGVRYIRKAPVIPEMRFS